MTSERLRAEARATERELMAHAADDIAMMRKRWAAYEQYLAALPDEEIIAEVVNAFLATKSTINVDWQKAPRGPHKVDDEVLAFLQARLVPGEPVRARELAKLLRRELDIELHPRTIERVLKKIGR